VWRREKQCRKRKEVRAEQERVRDGDGMMAVNRGRGRGNQEVPGHASRLMLGCVCQFQGVRGTQQAEAPPLQQPSSQ
jgi:hypothetical protein